MAFVNPLKPAGLSPLRYLNAAKYDGKGQMYCVLPTDTNPYWNGDLVTLVAAGGDINGIPAVTLATAGNPAVGVIVAIGTLNAGTGYRVPGGPYINPNNLNVVNRPAGAQSQTYYALVSDDPNIIYEIQEGGTAANLTPAAINSNANILYAAPGPSVHVSGTTLDGGSVANTATLNLKILRLTQRIDNHFALSPPSSPTGGAGQKWEVLINNHVFRAGTAGI
jgi:hypothetical protein